MDFFFDAFALVEIINGNPAYSNYRDSTAVTCAPVLAEVFYYALRTGQSTEFKLALQRLKPIILQAGLDDWEQAAAMKFENRGRRLSYVDCLGYTLALKNNLRFLTGDAQFRKMPNVEFVK